MCTGDKDMITDKTSRSFEPLMLLAKKYYGEIVFLCAVYLVFCFVVLQLLFPAKCFIKYIPICCL